MPFCRHCKNELGKRKKFQSNRFNEKYCLETEECIRAWRDDRISGEAKAREKKQKADWKAQKKVLKEKTKKLSEYEAEAKKAFQKFIRLRDADKDCASCPTTETELWDGGHWKKAEIYSGLIFDERNCHKQCRKCNRFLGGNEGEYRIKLVKRFGEEWVRQLEDDADRLRNYKYTKEELVSIKKKYEQKIKDLVSNAK